MKKSILKDYSFKLSILGIEIYRQMKNQNEYVISKQLLRSITSIGANIHEAYDAESKKDFIHKLSISLKESKETDYWIRLLNDTDLVTIEFEELKEKLNSITALLVSTIKTSKQNLREI